MVRRSGADAPVEELARASADAAWRLALVAGADQDAASRAAIHALVIAAVQGAAAAEPAAILALARTWALSSPGPGPSSSPGPGSEPVAAAFWSLPEPLRAALWCTDVLRLPAGDAERVLGPGAPAAATVARGRLRRRVCLQRRAETAGSGCSPCAALVGKVLTGHAAASQARLVDAHAADCRDCARLLEALRDPGAAVAAALPPAPDLVVPARSAWRDHVGAPRRPLPGRGAIDFANGRRRPVAAVLALVTAGSLVAATSQLAVAAERPSAPGWFAAPVLQLVRPAPPAAAPVRRQAEIPPLAGDARLGPRLAALVTRELTEVAPLPTPAPPQPAAPTPAAPPAPPSFGEPPPAVDRSTTVSLALPLALPLPIDVEVGPTCSSVTVGSLRLTLLCRR